MTKQMIIDKLDHVISKLHDDYHYDYDYDECGPQNIVDVEVFKTTLRTLIDVVEDIRDLEPNEHEHVGNNLCAKHYAIMEDVYFTKRN